MNPNDTSKKYFDVAKPHSTTPKTSTAPILNNPKRQMINIAGDDKPPEESQPISNIDDDNQLYDDTLMDQPEASEPSASSISHPDLEIPADLNKGDEQQTADESNIEAKDEPVKNDEDTPFVNPLPGTIEEPQKPVEIEKSADESPDQENKPPTLPPEELKTEKSAGEKVIEPIEKADVNEKPAEEKSEPDTPAPPPERFSAIDALPEDEKPSEEADKELQDPTIYDTKEYYVPIGSTHHSHGGLKMAFVFGLLCAVIVVGAIVYYVAYLSK